MGLPVSDRMGTYGVQGGRGQVDCVKATGRSQGQDRPTDAPWPPGRPFVIQLALWDEHPWTDLPARLAKGAGVRLAQADERRNADAMLVIRRWPTPMVLARLADAAAAATKPVLLCTAAPSLECAEALKLGIADIVRDDMHHAEVLARLALRCGAARGMEGLQLAIGPLLLDRVQRLAWLQGRLLRVTPLQFDLLAALMAAHGAPVATETLRKAVWHTAHDPGTNRLAVHVHHVRRALQDAGGGLTLQSAGGGYALILEQPA